MTDADAAHPLPQQQRPDQPTVPAQFGPPYGRARPPNHHQHTDTRSTRHLCAGTYLDQEFCDNVLSRIYYRPDRAIAAASGADAAAVINHALRARLLAALQAGCLLVLFLISAVVASPDLLFGMVVATASIVSLQILISQIRLIRDILTRIRSQSGSWRPIAVRAIGLYAAGVFLMGTVAVISIQRGYATIEQTPGTLDVRYVQKQLIDSTQYVFLILMGTTIIVFAIARRFHIHRLARSSGLIGHSDQRPLVDWIRRAQYGNVSNYAGYDPFAQLGIRIRDWHVTLPLRQSTRTGPNRPGWPHFDTVTLTEHIRRKLMMLAQDLTGSTRLPGLRVNDQAVVSGLETVIPTHATNDLARSHQLSDMDSIRRDPTTAVRHFLKCEISSLDGEIVTTVHIHAAMQGGTLHLAFHSFALPPTRTQFHTFDNGTGNVYELVKDIGRSLMRLPELLLSAPVVLWKCVADPIAANLRSRIDPSAGLGIVDHGAHHSVRTLGTDLDVQQYFQHHDAVKYTSILENQLLDAVIEHLDGKVDTFRLRQRAITIVNTGVVNNGPVYTATQQGTGKVGAMGPGASTTVTGGQQP